MTEPTLPRWATAPDNPGIDIVEPSNAQKDEGWNALQKPPYNTFNWLQRQTYEYLNFLRGFTNPLPIIRSDGPALFTESTGATVLSKTFDIEFFKFGVRYTNKIPASTLTLAANQVVVARLDTSASTVTLTLAGSYAAMTTGQYVVVSEASLDATKFDVDFMVLRRTTTSIGNDPYGLGFSTIEVIPNGTLYSANTGTTVRFFPGGNRFGDINLYDGKSVNLFSDNGVTFSGKWNGATGQLSILTGAKIDFDSGVGNEWIRKNGTGTLEIAAGNVVVAKFINLTGPTRQGIALPAGFQLYFDNAADTYITQSSDNVLDFVLGGATTMKINSSSEVRISNADLWITINKKVYFDHLLQSYITQSSANVLDFVVGGATTLKINSSVNVQINNADLQLTTAKFLYLDGAAHLNAIRCSINGSVDITAAGSVVGQFLNLTTPSRQGLYLPAGMQLGFDGGAKTEYMLRSALGNIEVFANSLSLFHFVNLSGPTRQGVAVNADLRLFFDGLTGVNWINYNTGSNWIEVFTQNAQRLRISQNANGGIEAFANLTVNGSITSTTNSPATPVVAATYNNNVNGAWCYFVDTGAANGTPMAIQRGHNVASVTRTATGIYQVNFQTAARDALYAFTGTSVVGGNNGDDFVITQIGKTTTTATLGRTNAQNGVGTLTNGDFNFTAVGL